MSFVDISAMFGSATEYHKEHNDCTVKAFAIAFDTSYDKAHAFLKAKCGRQNRKGLRVRQHLPMKLKKTKTEIVEDVFFDTECGGPITLNAFCKKYPKGRFYVTVRGHALAVVDGVVYDWKHGLKRKVLYAFQVFLEE